MTKTKNSQIKISLMGSFSDKFVPEDISTISKYHLNYNLWDTLLTSDRNPAAGRLETLSPDGKTYVFSINEKSKFSNGRKIQTTDVKFSFERIMHLEENGHVNAKGLIDSVNELSEDKVEIRLKAPTPSFIFLLSTPEFAIIPSEACDPATLQISRLDITSGAYTLLKSNKESGTLTLEKNNYFFRHSKASPDEVEIYFSIRTGENPADLRDRDFYEIYNSTAENVISHLDSKDTGLKYTITKPSLSTFLVRNPKKISKERAVTFAKKLQEAFQFESKTENKSFQLLPPKTYGSLNPEELPNLKDSKNIEKIVIKVANPNTELMKRIKLAESRLGISLEIIDLKSNLEADFRGASQGMNADFPEIELYLALLSPYAYIQVEESIKVLVQKAFHENNLENRSKLIKAASKELLESGTIVPVTVRSYLHVYDSKKLDISETLSYDGDIPIWKFNLL